MRNVIIALIILLSFNSCQKAIEKVQEEAVIEAITTGYWTVTKFTKGATDVTTDFNSYLFQFNENNTVDALKNNVFERSGSWQANASTRTINAQFSNSGAPLALLNGTWSITNSTMTSVNATQTINTEVYQLQLNKQ